MARARGGLLIGWLYGGVKQPEVFADGFEAPDYDCIKPISQTSSQPQE
ncbi:hypothetical protein [Fluviibacter sp.]